MYGGGLFSGQARQGILDFLPKIRLRQPNFQFGKDRLRPRLAALAPRETKFPKAPLRESCFRSSLPSMRISRTRGSVAPDAQMRVPAAVIRSEKHIRGITLLKKLDTFTPQTLRDTLSAAPHPLSLDEILRRAGLSRRLKREVVAALHGLTDDGTLARLRGGTWTPASRLKNISGVLAMQRSGAAFVTPEHHDPRGGHDIYIAPGAVGDAWNGDVVDVALLPVRRGAGAEGRVLRVRRRGETELTVRVLRPARRNGLMVSRPADARFAFDMLVDVSGLPVPPEPGELVRVTPGERLPSPTGEPLWSGTALRSLGREDEVAVQEQLTKLNHLIPQGFPDNAQTEATAAARREPDAEPLADLCSLALVTIDGEDARDFDDAVYVERRGDGWRLLVAIADVALYVRPRGVVDREARERGNSYYFPASVEPMLPEALSNGVCSLRPGEDRRVLVADMNIDATGRTVEATFAAGLMRSRARLTYNGVQDLLDGGKTDGADGGSTMPTEVAAMVRHAADLAGLLIARRQKRGGLNLDLPEAEFVIDKGRVVAVRNRQRLFSHRLIEAFMVAANEAVAEFLTARSAPFLYRVHPGPGPEKTADLIRALNATGLSLPRPAARMAPQARLRWLQAVLETAADTEQAFLVNRLVLRSMMQARYDPEAGSHFGLASPCYCHFTSPIRRYADLVTHRALRRTLGLDAGGPLPTGHKLLAVAEQCNGRERAAQDAEREITRRLGCLLLRDRVGEAFRGVISGVMPFGLFVELENMPLEGMVRVESLGRDYFEYDADRQELRGRLGGQAYRLGEPLEVRLLDVNVGRLEITLNLADGPEDIPSHTSRRARSARTETAARPGRRQQPELRERTRERSQRPERAEKPVRQKRRPTHRGGKSGRNRRVIA